jgi:hypothetical protein
MLFNIKRVITLNQKMKRLIGKIFIISPVLCFVSNPLFAQVNLASPSNWLYPDGNSEGTHTQKISSGIQPLKELALKWSSSAIAGDVQPLIGNIINNNKINSLYTYAPNEIVAVMGDKIVMLDATGRTIETDLPKTVTGIKSVSCLFDTTDLYINSVPGNTVVLGLETMEMQNFTDSLAFSYLAGYDNVLRIFRILNRLAIDLRPYKPNIFASVKPVFGQKTNSDVSIYSIVNMSNPSATITNPPFFRGMAQFSTANLILSYPFPDIGDLQNYRVMVGPEVNKSQPSLSPYGGGLSLLLPVYPTPNLNSRIGNSVLTDSTDADKPYLIGINLGDTVLRQGLGVIPLAKYIPASSSRPFIKPFYINIKDQNSSDSVFILFTEQYNGIDSSHGQSRLHLLDKQGTFLTLPPEMNPVNNPSFLGGNNHYWSVAVGNVDGISSNSWLPYYPNNAGNELVVTQSSRDFAYALNKIFILRYNSGSLVPKSSPPGTFLNQFDTICSQRINGWVAAVNDLDGAPDKKDEIILVDGSTFRILRMKDYADLQFRAGYPFDTVYTHTFTDQTISNVAVADLDGDGLNDIIVTTFDSTYVFGTIFSNAIDVIEPIATNTYCAGDTVIIKWKNIVKDQSGVKILYIPVSGFPPGDTMVIANSFPNNADTVTYNYIADSLTLGSSGYFIVENENQPHVKDSTAILIFNKPSLDSIKLNKTTFYPGENLIVDGVARCVDSVAIEYRYLTDSTWIRLNKIHVKNNQNFSIEAVIPCVSFFNCDSSDTDSLIEIQILSIKGIYKDTSFTSNIRVLPLPFPVVIDTCPSVCKTRYFSWNTTGFPFTCDSVNIYVSYNCSGSFSILATVPIGDGKFEWDLPLNLPDCVTIRFCCQNSCIRTDTTLMNNKVQYINLVAPNPFNPTMETANIVYKVPSETNVTIRILDQSNKLVAELANSKSCQPGISYCEKWNGTVWNGSYATNGIYYIMLEMSNGIKEVYPIFVRK